MFALVIFLWLFGLFRFGCLGLMLLWLWWVFVVVEFVGYSSDLLACRLLLLIVACLFRVAGE